MASQQARLSHWAWAWQHLTAFEHPYDTMALASYKAQQLRLSDMNSVYNITTDVFTAIDQWINHHPSSESCQQQDASTIDVQPNKRGKKVPFLDKL